MRLRTGRLGVSAGAVAVLLASSLSAAATAATASPSSTPSASGTSSAGGAVTQKSTGVAAGTDVPSGAVMVLLKNQLDGTPADPSHIGARRSAATGQQSGVLRDAGVSLTGAQHFTLVNAVATTVTPAQAQKLAQDPRVASIVPNTRVDVTSPATAAQATREQTGRKGGPKKQPSKVPTAKTDPYAICPSDPAKPMLEPEALTAIKAASTDGSDAAWDHATGKGVKVAVMAEGIDPTAPDYRRADGTSAIVDYQNFSGAPESSVQYGEEIFGDASSIAAQGTVVHDLADYVHVSHALPQGCTIRIKGVAPDAGIVALNILGGGTGTDDSPSYALPSVIAQAIDYAVTVRHVDILSESIGQNAIPDESTRAAVQQFNDAAVDAGVTVVASTGDAGVTGTMGSPSVDPKVIGAAATTTLRAYEQIGYTGTLFAKHRWINGNISSFSSGGFSQSGKLPVLAAPGDSGWAACTDKRDKPGCADNKGGASSIELFGGTSQSAPFVAGVAALVVDAFKSSHHGTAPTPAQIRQIMTATATDIGAPGQQQGSGQVDALAAVTLARTFGQRTGPGTAALTTDVDQLQVTGAPGAAVSRNVTITNQSNKKVSLAPRLRQLVPASYVNASTALAKDGPTFLGAGGAVTTYKKVTFEVPKGIDQFALRYAYGAKGTETVDSPYTAVNMSLISPDGSYVGNTRPQNGVAATGTSAYGRFDVVHPAAGTWTAVFASAPSQRNATFGAPVATVPYAGPIDYRVDLNRWQNTGVVTPAQVTLKGHASATVKVTSALPQASGDSTITLGLGAPRGVTAPVIPISQRVVVPLSATGGRFTGTMTGGNGRGGAPAQQDTFAMTVPSGKQSLQVKVAFPLGYEAQGLRVGLVDPNGIVQAVQSNASVADAGSSATLNVARPVAGDWKIVVWQLVTTFGRQVSTPYVGTIGFDNSGVSSSGLAALGTNAPLTTLPAGQETRVNVTVRNDSSITQSYGIDPRTASLESVTYPSYTAKMPADVLGILGSLNVAPQTRRLDVAMTAPVAIQASVAGPGTQLALAGTSAVGRAAQPSNGSATSTATLSSASGQLTPGLYSTQPGNVGPFGADGAPKATATIRPTAYTAGFDTAVRTDLGDPYLPTSDPMVAHTFDVKPGATATVTLRIDPQAAVGSTVTGRINVITLGDTGLFSLILPYLTATDQVVDSFDYRYKVGAAQPQVAGTVTGSNGAAIGGVTVKAFDASGAIVQNGLTAADGTYRLGGLTAGTAYSVCFDPSSVTPKSTAKAQCWKDVAWDGTTAPSGATPVTAPAPGSPVTGIDAVLQIPTSVAGRVLDSAGNPIANAMVMLGDTTTGVVDMSSLKLTDATGSFSYDQPAATSTICVQTLLLPASTEHPRGLVSQCGGAAWAYRGTGAEVPATAAPFSLVEGQVNTRDVVLRDGASVTGTVLTSDGTPKAGVMVVALAKDGGMYGGIGATDDVGHYTVIGLPAESLGICAGVPTAATLTCAPDKAVSDANVPLPTGTTLLTPPAGGTVTGPSFTLLPQSGPAAGAAATNGAAAQLLHLKEVLTAHAK
ncbi:S8 family serine peptidase [Nocardioides sp.]|uniref:S8 family serine peptidase n=1 Tax=Nocardioides sp. TaxID=35761 RepID=UPI00260FF822|nr:S8 family serine peptidase [Nocardioides sp.]